VVEPLDPRVMLTVTAVFGAGELKVIGDDQDNVIVVSRTVGGAILVNGGVVPIAGGAPTVANANHLHLVGAGGADRISLDETNGPLPGAALFGGDGNDVLVGGSMDDFAVGEGGNDTVSLGAGEDTFGWNPGDGSDVVDGQAGLDVLVFNGSELGEKFGIADTGAGTPLHRVRLTRDVGNVALDFGGFETLNLNPLAGADTVTIDDQAATDLTMINIDLEGPGTGMGDGEVDTIVVNGTNGDDLVRAQSFLNHVVAQVGLLPVVNLIGTDASADRLTLSALGGNDTIDASGLAANGPRLTVDGGAGNDQIFGSAGVDSVIGGLGNDTALLGAGDDSFVWNAGDGDDVVEGEGGTDSLVFNGSAADEQIEVAANGPRLRVTDDVGNVSLDLGGVEQAGISPVAGADDVVIGDLTGTAVRLVRVKQLVDAGADDVIVNGTNDTDMIQVNGDLSNGVDVTGLFARVELVGGFGVGDGLTVRSQGGADTVDATALTAGLVALSLDGGSGNDTLIGSGGNDVVVGGTGNDVARLGAGDDTFTWNPGDGSDTAEGQAGRDVLAFNGSDQNESVAISANGGRVKLTRDVGGVTMDVDDVEELQLHAAGGTDTLTVNDLTGTDVQKIDEDVSAAAGGADGQSDSIVVNGSDRGELIPISGAAGGVLVNGAFLTQSGLPYFMLIRGVDAMDSLRVNGNGGDDQIKVELATTVNLKVDGGAGQDTIDLGATADNAAVHVLPSAGDDAVNVNADGLGVVNAVFDSAQRVGALTVGTGGVATLTPGGVNTLTATSLAITGTGVLDLTDNALIVDYSLASTIANVRALLTSGFNGGAWNGIGIRTSLGNSSRFALGFAEASDVAKGGLFGGQNVDGTAVVVKFTTYGDANLDGAVDFSDLVRLAQHFNTAGGGWAQGNFNYDNTVDFGDLVKLAQNYNTTGVFSIQGRSVLLGAAAAESSRQPKPGKAVAPPVTRRPAPHRVERRG
jgi:hypothetical protein